MGSPQIKHVSVLKWDKLGHVFPSSDIISCYFIKARCCWQNSHSLPCFSIKLFCGGTSVGRRLKNGLFLPGVAETLLSRSGRGQLAMPPASAVPVIPLRGAHGRQRGQRPASVVP